jgi:hypothetical protein
MFQNDIVGSHSWSDVFNCDANQHFWGLIRTACVS